jgi:hypothetical protein
MNFRTITFTHKCWILLLGFPLDLKDSNIITRVCSLFAKVLHWNSKDPRRSRVLKVLVEDPLEVPHSLVIKMVRVRWTWKIVDCPGVRLQFRYGEWRTS